MNRSPVEDLQTILVVDDSPHDYETYVRYLNKARPNTYRTKFLSVGKQVFSTLGEGHPYCALLDLSLPDMTGLDIIQKLTKDNGGALPFPIVIVTGSGDETTGQKAVSLGAQDYLIKQEVTQESLTRAIEFAVTRFQLEQRLRESEERFRLAAAATHSMVYDIDLRMMRLSAMQGLPHLLGYQLKKTEMTLTWWERQIYSEDLAAYRAAFQQMLSDGLGHKSQYRISHKDGRLLWVEDSVVGVRDDVGQLVRGVGTVVDITERRQAEEKIKLASERFEVALRGSAVVVFNQDLELRYTWIYNPAFGYSPAEVIGKRDIDIFERAEDGAVTEAIKSEVIQTGNSRQQEVSIYWQGIKRHYDLIVDPLRDSNGNIIGVTCAAVDVTERKQAEEAIRKNEERLRLAHKAARSGAWEWNMGSGEIIWSPEVEELYGLQPGTFRGGMAAWRPMVHPEDLKHIDQTLPGIIERGGDFRIEFRIRHASGETRWIEATGQILRDGEKSPRIVGINTDITRRKQEEWALQQSEVRSRQLIESNIIPVIFTAQESVKEANDAFLRMLGYTREDVQTGQLNWVKLTPPEHRFKDLEALGQLASHGQCTPFEKEYFHKDGHRVPILIGATALNSSPLECLCFILDLSELKRIEGELRRSQTLLEQKVADRTQELAQSLAKVESEIAVRKTIEEELQELSARVLRLQDEEHRRLARDLHDSVGQTLIAIKMSIATLGNVVNNLPEGAKLLDDLNALTDDAIKDIRTTAHLLHPPLLDEVGFTSAAQWYVDELAKRSGIKTNLELSSTPPLTKAAELALFRVLQESLTNVLRHSGSTAVDVRLHSDGANAYLTVRDYGKGIPAEKLANFHETGTGVGIGLGGMKQRLRDLHGQLKVNSDSTGTRITASLPVTVPGRTDDDGDGGSKQGLPAA